jgi:uncharacterized cupin superfamily protein
MKIINSNDVSWERRASPSGKYCREQRNISEALGRDRRSTDLDKRHPFDVDVTKIPPKAALCPYHSHSAQWEFYHVISGEGTVRHAEGSAEIVAGDAFIFKPGEPHQIVNTGSEDLIVYVIADNPVGESCFYPDSNKWAVKSPDYRIIRSDPLDYYDGEDP